MAAKLDAATSNGYDRANSLRIEAVMKRLLSAVMMAAVMLAGLAGPAWAEDVTKKVEELSAQAAQAYGEGDFEQAIALFQEAYDLQPVPNLLFNIAKVYEKTENWDAAEKNYKEFIKSPDADSQAREVALERIDAIKEIKAAAAAAEREKAEEEKKDPVVEDPPPQTVEKKSNVLPWIVMGSGAGVAAVGGVFGILAMGKQKEFDEAETAADKQELRKSGKTFALVADISYAVGLVGIVTGVVLLVTSGGSDDGAATAIAPTGWVGPNGQAGIGAMLRF